MSNGVISECMSISYSSTLCQYHGFTMSHKHYSDFTEIGKVAKMKSKDARGSLGYTRNILCLRAPWALAASLEPSIVYNLQSDTS
jgi:hypothetical protein